MKIEIHTCIPFIGLSFKVHCFNKSSPTFPKDLNLKVLVMNLEIFMLELVFKFI